MIEQLDIAKFGSFLGFQWKASVRDKPGNNVQNFKKLNIIYGRNYAGKTTLSRVFRSFETGEIPPHFDGSSFSVRGEHGELSHKQLSGHNYNIRVYNKDFVAENLSFLTDQVGGRVETFAIVGGENNALAERISALRDKLGSMDEKIGARHDTAMAAETLIKARRKVKDEVEALNETLRRHANDVIKPDRAIGHPRYNIDSIRADINHVLANHVQILTEVDRATHLSLLKEEALPAVRETASFESRLDAIFQEARPLITSAIEPTRPIQDLLDDVPLQAWVREGIPLHKEKRDDCAFCRQKLPSDLWQRLSEHFNKASEMLARSVGACLDKIHYEKQRASFIPTTDSTELYAAERPAFDKAKFLLQESIRIYKSDLEKLAEALTKRRASLFQVGRLPLLEFEVTAGADAIQAFNSAVAASNRRSSTLNADKERARLALRYSKVAEFLSTFDYAAKNAGIELFEVMSVEAAKADEVARQAVRNIEQEIRQLEAQQKDERKGAERVNFLLNHHFGHGGVRLEAVDDGGTAGVKFQVMRGEHPAFNLSEGEGSLIAFCYFMAKLEALDTGGKELIIYIDDPMSSLDSNHVFFVYSLIEHLLCAPVKKADGTDGYKYKQLFLSTHNLDFLKYLKRLSGPKRQMEHFIVERHGTASSRLSLMPAYLKKYVTEFNYLFHQLHKCSLEVPQGGDHDHFFSFGNNLRKFLEVYLYFKYPHGVGQDSATERVSRFFAGDEMAGTIASRLGNELSHLEESFERGMSPIDIPEIQKIATHVLSKIEAADRPQYDALMASIGAD